MLFVNEKEKIENINKINNFFTEVNNEFDSVITIDANEPVQISTTQKYLNSLVTMQYQRSIEAIENTIVGNKRKRKRNLQQVMQESFFSGANRFGNNFIA